MLLSLDDATAVLRRTPAVLRTLLQGLPPEWTAANEGGNTWSPFDVLGHLIHGERTDWMPRVRIILERGETRPFDPFDRLAQFKTDRHRSTEQLLDIFEALRRDNLRSLSELQLDLKRTGIHPELGRVTLEELIATWVVHDLDHIVQISRTLAKQYGDAVGPWKKYLSVLHDAAQKGK
jgi:hypothetical protein